MESASFDAVILNLVLSVVPDPTTVVAETMRVLRPGGRVVVLDKFAPEGRTPSLARQLLNLLTRVLGTAINRKLSDILASAPCQVISDEPSILAGQYRVVLLRRNGAATR